MSGGEGASFPPKNNTKCLELSLRYCLAGRGEPHNPLSCETSRRRGPAHSLDRAAVPNSGKGEETLWILNLRISGGN